MIHNNGVQPTRVTAEQWGRKVSIELPYSDTDLNELIDIFKGISMGLGYDESSWNDCITEMAEEISETKMDSLSEWSDDELGEAIAEFNHLESLED